MPENIRDPFAEPETAAEEMRERAQVLRKKALRARDEAADLRAKADELSERATKQDRIAQQYEALLAKPDVNVRGQYGVITTTYKGAK